MKKVMSSRDSWLKHSDPQRSAEASQNHLEGLFHMVHQHPRVLSYLPQGIMLPSPSENHTFTAHQHNSYVLMCPATVFCRLYVLRQKRVRKILLWQEKALENIKTTVAKSYKGLRNIHRARICQERFQEWVAFLKEGSELTRGICRVLVLLHLCTSPGPLSVLWLPGSPGN